MRDIVYFDLETRHSAAEVGGWHNTAEMRLSVGVTYSTASGKYTIYSEEMVDDLIRQLSQADLVVGMSPAHVAGVPGGISLGELAGTGEAVADPFGGDADTYRLCADQIARLLKAADERGAFGP